MTADSLPKDMTGETKRLDWRLMLPVFVIVSLYAAGMAAVMPVPPFYYPGDGGLPAGPWHLHRDRSL